MSNKEPQKTAAVAEKFDKASYPKNAIFTKLKFKKSDRTNAIVGFVSINPKNRMVYGVREDDPVPKSVCVVDASIAKDIILDALYDVVIVPMKQKSGYVVIDARVYQFRATIETNYVPKACYIVDVKFGNRLVRFDPKDGNRQSMNTISGVVEVLEHCVDIYNVCQVIEDFTEAAQKMLRRYISDGYVPRKAK